MNSLFFQVCDIKRRTVTSYDNGTPVFTDVVVQAAVPCRVDFLHSRLRPSNDSSNPASFAEQIYGTAYFSPSVNIDNTCFIEISGDSNKYEVVMVNKAPAFGSIHHLECDVRVVTHR